MILHCRTCHRFENVVRFPWHCRCGVTVQADEAEDASHLLPSRRGVKRCEILVQVTKACVKCDAFPCLAETDCKHEKQLRTWVECPQGMWFYV